VQWQLHGVQADKSDSLEYLAAEPDPDLLLTGQQKKTGFYQYDYPPVNRQHYLNP